VRDALHATPTPETTVSDPLPAITRRVRRTRVVVAASGVAVVAAAVAVVVPTVGLGGSATDKVAPLESPTAAPSPSPSDGSTSMPAPGVVDTGPRSPSPSPTSSPNTTTLWSHGANWVSTSADGSRWLLYTADGHTPKLGRLVGADQAADIVTPPTPADEVYAGRSIQWVVGSDDGGSILSRVSAYSAGALLATKALPTTLLTYAVVSGDDLYVETGSDTAGSGVARFRVQTGGIDESDATLPDQGNGLSVTGNGAVWAETSHHLVEIQSTATGVRTGHVFDAFGYVGGMDLSNPDTIWGYDGRLIQLTPATLSTGGSVSELDRIPVDGVPRFAVGTGAGGVFVATSEPAGLYYFSRAAAGSSTNDPTATLPITDAVAAMTHDPDGGAVDIVTSDGRLLRWNPAT
jgi:hypothetical protein